MRSYDAADTVIGSSTFTHDVSGTASQSTLLFATPQAEAQFGVAAASLAGGIIPTRWNLLLGTIDCVS